MYTTFPSTIPLTYKDFSRCWTPGRQLAPASPTLLWELMNKQMVNYNYFVIIKYTLWYYHKRLVTSSCITAAWLWDVPFGVLEEDIFQMLRSEFLIQHDISICPLSIHVSFLYKLDRSLQIYFLSYTRQASPWTHIYVDWLHGLVTIPCQV